MSEAIKNIVCFCNGVSIDTIEAAVQGGAHSLAQVYDRTNAGTGPCGGSCRDRIQKILERNSLESTAPPNPATEVPYELVEAISLFNRRYYWETHEVLERVWMDEHGPSRKFFQGIIQASAALYHVLNANPKGVIRLAEEAVVKLKPYYPSHLGVPLESLGRSMENYAEQARQILGQVRDGFDYDALPYLTIGSQMENRK